MPRYWVATRHPDQHAAKSGHLETLSRISSAEIAMRCGAQRGPSAPWNRKRGRRLRLRTCTSLCPSFLQGPRWAGTCCPSRQFVVVSIYRLQNGIASATAASCHWPDGLRLGCGAAESQHCPITPAWLAGGRRFRQRQVGRPQLSIGLDSGDNAPSWTFVDSVVEGFRKSL